jgi:hypothetical protein
MFQAVTQPRTLAGSDYGVAVSLTFGAVLVILVEGWKWAIHGKAATLAILYMPAFASSAWFRVATQLDWSDATRRRQSQVQVLLTVFYSTVFVYGWYRWQWHDGEILLPACAFVNVAADALGFWLQSRRAPSRRGAV